MLAFLAIILAFSYAPLLVASHGFLQWVEVDGTRYNGIEPRWGADVEFRGSQTPIRLVVGPPGDDGYGEGPIPNPFHNPDMACGPGALVARGEITAQAGSTITFSWRGASGINWIHEKGPIHTYMTSCGAKSCTQFSRDEANAASWFKVGALLMDQNNEWYQKRMRSSGYSFPARIPEKLKPGNYLVRSEITATHLGPPEFFAACVQFKITGSGTGEPSQQETCSFRPPTTTCYDEDPTARSWELLNQGVDVGPPIVSLSRAPGSSALLTPPQPDTCVMRRMIRRHRRQLDFPSE